MELGFRAEVGPTLVRVRVSSGKFHESGVFNVPIRIFSTARLGLTLMLFHL